MWVCHVTRVNETGLTYEGVMSRMDESCHTYVWTHLVTVSFMCVTRLIHLRDMTHSCTWHDAYKWTYLVTIDTRYIYSSTGRCYLNEHRVCVCCMRTSLFDWATICGHCSFKSQCLRIDSMWTLTEMCNWLHITYSHVYNTVYQGMCGHCSFKSQCLLINSMWTLTVMCNWLYITYSHVYNTICHRMWILLIKTRNMTQSYLRHDSFTNNVCGLDSSICLQSRNIYDLRRVMHVHESCYTCRWVTSRIYISHVFITRIFSFAIIGDKHTYALAHTHTHIHIHTHTNQGTCMRAVRGE